MAAPLSTAVRVVPTSSELAIYFKDGGRQSDSLGLGPCRGSEPSYLEMAVCALRRTYGRRSRGPQCLLIYAINTTVTESWIRRAHNRAHERTLRDRLGRAKVELGGVETLDHSCRPGSGVNRREPQGEGLERRVCKLRARISPVALPPTADRLQLQYRTDRTDH